MIFIYLENIWVDYIEDINLYLKSYIENNIHFTEGTLYSIITWNSFYELYTPFLWKVC